MPRQPNTNSPKYNDPFPTRLRELIKERNVRQEELTAVLGVKNRQSVTGYIDGSTVPTAEKVSAVAMHFGVSADYLLGIVPWQTADHDKQSVCAYTGLSEEAVTALANSDKYKDEISRMILALLEG